MLYNNYLQEYMRQEDNKRISSKFHNEFKFGTVYTYLSTISVNLVSSISLESPFVFRKACMDVAIAYGFKWHNGF